MLNLSQRQTLQLKLTPQQVQYLQLLQLPVLALEQRIKAELEINPLLEETDEMETSQETEELKVEEQPEAGEVSEKEAQETAKEEEGYTFEDFMNDDLDGYKATRVASNDEDRDEFPQPAEVSITQKLMDQLHFLDLSDNEELLAEEIIGNIDEDGYLRRELQLIVQDLNLAHELTLELHAAETVLQKIQRLDPPGIAARSLQECLLAQLEVREFEPRLKELAVKVLTCCYRSTKPTGNRCSRSRSGRSSSGMRIWLRRS